MYVCITVHNCRTQHSTEHVQIFPVILQTIIIYSLDERREEEKLVKFVHSCYGHAQVDTTTAKTPYSKNMRTHFYSVQLQTGVEQ